MDNGKDKCEILKAIRAYVAEKYGLNYSPTECTHKGDCPGTCPKCDAELAALQKQLEDKGITDINADPTLSKMVEKYLVNSIPDSDDTTPPLAGIPEPPDKIEELEGDIMPPEEPEKRYARKLILECPVAGLGFHDVEEYWDELYEGAKLALVREPENPHDQNAIAIALPSDYDGDPDNFDFEYCIGYIPRKSNATMAAMLDMGWANLLEAEISKMNEHAPINDRLYIKVYIKSKEPLQPKDNRLRLQNFTDDAEWSSLEEELMQKGYAYCRWGGFPPEEHDLPERGDKVVFLHKAGQSVSLYLMMTVATDDKCRAFLSNKESLDYVDDCRPFIMTVVKGPVAVKKKDIRFLDNILIECYQPDQKLEKDLSDQLLNLL
jgi:hypothetical protein